MTTTIGSARPAPKSSRSRTFSRGLAAALALGPLALAGCGATTTATSAPGTTAGGPVVTVAPSTTAHRGGSVVYGLEAESDGLDTATNRWSVSSFQLGNAVYDPLTAMGADGQAHPYLAESLTPNSDFTEWTIKLRRGVVFHDGTPLNAEALIKNLAWVRRSPLTGGALTLLDPETPAVKVDDLTVRVPLTGPWAQFPVAMTGQVGFIEAPAQIDTADAGTRGHHPVGTGPFTFQEWKVDAQFTAKRNDHYWRTDDRGQSLPYLESVTFRPMTDTRTRAGALKAGDIDLMSVSTPDLATEFTDLANDGRYQIARDPGQQEKFFLMFNLGAAPTNDLRLRQAVAYGIDVRNVLAAQGADDSWRADSIFSRGTPWYTDTHYPAFDPARAKQLVDDYEAEHGALTLHLQTTTIPDDQRGAQVVQAELATIGIDVTIESSELATLITKALTGTYEVAYWRQFGDVDPGSQYLWWTSANANEPGEGRLALNMARVKDPVIDQALDEARRTNDPTSRRTRYAKVAQRMTDLLPYVWLQDSVKFVFAAPKVRDFLNGPLPDGGQPLGLATGTHRLTHTWIDA